MLRKVNSGIKRGKWFFNDFFNRLGMQKLPLKKEVSRILVYHGFAPQLIPNLNGRFIRTLEFEEQARFFKEHCEVVDLETYTNGYRAPHKMTLSLTFDDGYLNNLSELLPILEKHQLPATFFITGIVDTSYPMLWPDLVDMLRIHGPDQIEFNGFRYRKTPKMYKRKGANLKNDLVQTEWKIKDKFFQQFFPVIEEKLNESDEIFWKQLDREQIKALAEHPLITIGSHGYYHNALGMISPENAVVEIRKSKELLEEITNKPIKYFAYPHNSYTRELVEAASAAGFEYQFCGDFFFEEDHKDPGIVERLCSNPFVSTYNQLKAIYDGTY